MKRGFLTIIVVAAICGVAHADPPAKQEEEPVDPTGLIIAGAALAAFALLFLIGRRSKSNSKTTEAPTLGDLAEVRIIVEGDERVTVWTTPTLKLHTDRLGEVVLNLPVGTHDVNLMVGDEHYTRSIQVAAIKKMRIPINLAKERISRAVSSEMQGTPSANHKPAVPMTPVKPATSLARALPDSSSQGKLGAELAGLIDVELDSPAAIELSPAIPARTKAPTVHPELRDEPRTKAPSIQPEPRAKAPSIQPEPRTKASTGQPLKLDFSTAADLAAPPPRTSPLANVPARSRPVTGSLANIPARGKPMTGPLDGITPSADRSGRTRVPSGLTQPPLDMSLDEPPARSVRPTAPPMLDALARPQLEDLAPPPRSPNASGMTPSNQITELELDDLGSAPAVAPMEMPVAAQLDLAPPSRAPDAPKVPKDSLPSVTDFALDDLPEPKKRAPTPLPTIDAVSVADLALDEDVPIQRVPTPSRPARPTPSLAEFTLEDDIALDGPRVGPAPKPLPMPRPAAPREASGPARPASPSRQPGVSGPPGTHSGRYRKIAPIGTGPSGTLYRGRDEADGRDVLIEQLPPEVTLAGNPKALASLTHANIVRFFDHVMLDGVGHVVTEVVEGKSLEQLLVERGGSMASLEAIGLVDQVCAALVHAHEHGVFHRAVRPSCVVMAGRTVKLRGFGMTLGASSTEYTAPELLVGAPADARSDLYSIGVLLAQMLTGSIPQAGKLQFPSDVPRNLASLIRKLLSREPTIRPANAKIVRDGFSSIF